MTWVIGLAKALFESLIGGFLQSQKDRRQRDDLQSLGYQQSQIEALKAQQEAGRAARKIYAKPTPDSITGVLNRL